MILIGWICYATNGLLGIKFEIGSNFGDTTRNKNQNINFIIADKIQVTKIFHIQKKNSISMVYISVNIKNVNHMCFDWW